MFGVGDVHSSKERCSSDVLIGTRMTVINHLRYGTVCEYIHNIPQYDC